MQGLHVRQILELMACDARDHRLAAITLKPTSTAIDHRPQGGLVHTSLPARDYPLHLQARLLDVRKSEDTIGVHAATKDGIAAIAVGVDALTQENRDMIADLALRHRIPTIYGSREYVDAGGLIAYGPSYPSLYRQAATYVDKILKGASPAELPIQQPTRFELLINLKIAKALALTVPQLLLAQADEVDE